MQDDLKLRRWQTKHGVCGDEDAELIQYLIFGLDMSSEVYGEALEMAFAQLIGDISTTMMLGRESEIEPRSGRVFVALSRDLSLASVVASKCACVRQP